MHSDKAKHPRYDALDALILLSGDVLIEKNQQNDMLGDGPLVRRPKSLDRKIARMIRNEQRKPYNAAILFLRQTAAVFMIVCTLMFAMAMSVEAVREAFWNAVVEWYDKYISVVYVTEAEPPSVIEEYREPQLVPAGAERVVRKKTDYAYEIEYIIDNRMNMMYYQIILDNAYHYFDHYKIEMVDANVKSNPAMIITKNDSKKILTWSDGKYCYVIFNYSSTIFDEELLTIAESVK